MSTALLTRAVIGFFVLLSTSQWLQGQSAVSDVAQEDQHFVCNTGYTHSACHRQVEQLTRQLSRFRQTLPHGWTWIIVRSRDWHDTLLRLHLDPQSPAFTVLERRQTFLSETLFEPDAQSRADLLRTFKVPLDQILYVAVTHELGHAYCGESHEGKAERFAEHLRTRGSADCSSTRAASDTIATVPGWR